MLEYFIAYSKINHFNIIIIIHTSNMEYKGVHPSPGRSAPGTE
jgi:hypothetical protein